MSKVLFSNIPTRVLKALEKNNVENIAQLLDACQLSTQSVAAFDNLETLFKHVNKHIALKGFGKERVLELCEWLFASFSSISVSESTEPAETVVTPEPEAAPVAATPDVASTATETPLKAPVQNTYTHKQLWINALPIKGAGAYIHLSDLISAVCTSIEADGRALATDEYLVSLFQNNEWFVETPVYVCRTSQIAYPQIVLALIQKADFVIQGY